MKAILRHVHEDGGQKGRTGATIALAKLFNSQVQCLQVTPITSYVFTDPFGGLHFTAQIYDELIRKAHEEKVQIEKALTARNVAHRWYNFDGGVAQSIVGWSRLSDLIVISKPDYDREHAMQPIPVVADVAIHARSPVLALPLNSDRTFDAAGAAVIAWNGSAEGANALRAAVPLLAQASSVTIVTIGEENCDFPAASAAAYLSLHGIVSSHKAIGPTVQATADLLLQTAATIPAADLVMGA